MEERAFKISYILIFAVMYILFSPEIFVIGTYILVQTYVNDWNLERPQAISLRIMRSIQTYFGDIPIHFNCLYRDLLAKTAKKFRDLCICMYTTEVFLDQWKKDKK
jgi:hypothetical protein